MTNKHYLHIHRWIKVYIEDEEDATTLSNRINCLLNKRVNKAIGMGILIGWSTLGILLSWIA